MERVEKQQVSRAEGKELAANGDIIGHSHITIQNIGSLRSTTVPDAANFMWSRGVSSPGDGNGLLSVTMDGGLPPGWYRVCSMNAAKNHQPVAMPVAQRGPQDDCVRFEVV